MSTAPTTPDVGTVLLKHYEGFFAALPGASRMPEAARNQLLHEYLAGPAYSSVVASMSSQAAFGKALYGVPTLKPEIASVSPDSAVIRDCQDTSKSGVLNIKTGHKETKGVPRTLVITNFKQLDTAWRITKIDYQGPKC